MWTCGATSVRDTGSNVSVMRTGSDRWATRGTRVGEATSRAGTQSENVRRASYVSPIMKSEERIGPVVHCQEPSVPSVNRPPSSNSDFELEEDAVLQ
jgi:hypothetical protein